MRRVITGHDELFGPWIMARNGSVWTPDRGVTVGLWDDEKGPQACTMFESFNGASVMIHVAGEGRRWMTREFLWFSFYYPFVQLGVRKLIGPVESSNLDSIRLIEHLGFHLEATLKDAAPKGDLLIYTMTVDQCKWLSLEGKYRGQAQSTKPA